MNPLAKTILHLKWVQKDNEKNFKLCIELCTLEINKLSYFHELKKNTIVCNIPH